MGGDAPPVRTPRDWLTLWHGFEPKEIVGVYRTYWSLQDHDDPGRVIATDRSPLLEPAPELTRPIEHQMYLRDVVFTTGIVDAGDDYIVASGKAAFACRITRIPKPQFTERVVHPVARQESVPMDKNLIITCIGVGAGLCSMSSFVPQIGKIISEKSAEGVSLKMFAVTVTAFLLWTAYGVLLGSWPIAASNAICLALSLTIVVLRIKFGRGDPG